MPTHWESSKRPLFIRTVVVNGSRHAILTQEDPLRQTLTAAVVAKNSRPGSPHSSESSQSSIESAPSAEVEPQRKTEKSLKKTEKGKNKCTRDLQDCLVKLRLVLTTQETRKAVKLGGKHGTQTENKKRKRTSKCNESNKAREWHEPTQQPNAPVSSEDNSPDLQPRFKYDNNHNIAVASYFSTETRVSHCCHENEDKCEERISGHSEYSQNESSNSSGIGGALGKASNYDPPWNSISAESYFTRPFYNRMSERVLQWLDLVNKKAPQKTESYNTAKTESGSATKASEEKAKTKQMNRMLTQRGSSEDNAEEVRTEEDVDTALSKELPKFSEELNKLHYLKAAIPVKQEPYASYLQDAITQSFTTIVSIRSGKYAEKPREKLLPGESQRKGHLTRQVRIYESSDEEDGINPVLTESTKKFNKDFLRRNGLLNKTFDSQVEKRDIPKFSYHSQSPPQLPTRIPWLKDCKWPPEQEVTKPQLHIFIPAIPAENDIMSDSASVSSDS